MLPARIRFFGSQFKELLELLIQDSVVGGMDIDTLGQTYSIAQQCTLLQAADYGQAFCMFLFTSDQKCEL